MSRSLVCLCVLLLLGSSEGSYGFSPQVPKPVNMAEDLIGSWDVSLFYSRDKPPSKTEMVVEKIKDGALVGTFYGTPFDAGRVTYRQGKVIFTVITSDGSGQYVTSGRLDATGLIDGQTLSVGRDFLMAWQAKKIDR